MNMKRLQINTNDTYNTVEVNLYTKTEIYIKDANGFDYLSSYNRGIITYNGLGYLCYTMKDPVTIDNFVQKCN